MISKEREVIVDNINKYERGCIEMCVCVCASSSPQLKGKIKIILCELKTQKN